MRSHRLKCVTFAAAAALSMAILLGQSSTSQLNGTVTDPSGGGVPGSQIHVLNENTGIKHDVRANEQGNYAVPLLQPGVYTISVQAAGFKPLSRSGVVLELDQVARLDFTMEVGSVSETVTVNGSAPLLDQETSSLGHVIDQRAITELPLNGRNVLTLVQLSAGVLNIASPTPGFVDPGNFAMSNIAVSGGRGQFNALLLDGANDASPFQEEIVIWPSVDAVEEFKMTTNGASAEFGRTAGGVFNAVTKSGTNRLHGTGYEFVRNEVFDARNTFATARPPYRYNDFGGTIGGPIVLPKVYNGRNRSFFFFSYEGYRFVNYQNLVLTIPTAAQHTGNFSQTLDATGKTVPIYDTATTRNNPAGAGYVRDPFPGNIIPARQFDPVSKAVMSYVPLPNQTPLNSLTNIQNYGQLTRKLTNNDQWMGRFDHQLNDEQRLMLRYAFNRNGDGYGDTQFHNFLTNGANDDVQQRNFQSGLLGETHTLSPHTVGEFRLSYSLEDHNRLPVTSGKDVDRVGLPAILPRLNFPQLTIQDFTTIGGALITQRDSTVIDSSETITKIHGGHILKVGGDVRALRHNIFQSNGLNGTFNFARDLTSNPQVPTNTGYGVATFLLGGVDSGNINVATKQYLRGKYFAGFLQDDWRAGRRLTLNLGLRYEVQTQQVDRYNRMSNFNTTAINPITKLPGVLQYAGVDYGSSAVPNDYKDLGPRVGFAWTADAGRTVVRGSYGIYYQPTFETFQTNLGWSATTNFTDPSIGPRPTFYLAQGPSTILRPAGSSLGPAGFLGGSVQYRQASDRTPYVQQWNFGLQRALPGGWVIEVVYAGSKGTRLSFEATTANANQMDPQYLTMGFDLQKQVPNPFASLGVFGATVAQSQLLRPFPAYQGVLVDDPAWGSSIYHSLQTTARKRMSGGYSVLIAYTNSKLIDDQPAGGIAAVNASASATVQNAYNRRAERSISPQDVSQRLVVSHIIELPFGHGRRWVQAGVMEKVLDGWQLSGISTFSTGQPVIVRGAQNNAAARPNSTGQSAGLSADQRNRIKWFNTSAFVTPPLFTYGNVGRVLPDVRLPGLVNFDISLQKYFTVRENIRVQLRGEAFNLFNRTDLGQPNGDFTSVLFGRITSTVVAARLMQLGAKIIF